ncbi:SDR family NAD(P)-dependent oxidoreductase [Nocardia sp. NPDC056064]|uniref:SDR family NAD(P)-dependent oxidoreductase n=1 Tax=Nocardia sp. NPDC056064 TaxID=3345701 RepID=UPI0035E14E97
MSDIAVVGIGCRFAGGIDSPESFWDFFAEKRDDSNPAEFDPDFFGIPHREAADLDPRQRVLLEVIWEAMDDAGVAGKVGRHAVGVFVGGVVIDRIADVLGLTGPTQRCSSSPAAVLPACRALADGDCAIALAGGVHPASDGRGEGTGMVVLRRLDDAVRDGDRVYAVLDGGVADPDGRPFVRMKAAEPAPPRAPKHYGVLPISARSAAACRAMADRFADLLADGADPDRLAEAAWTRRAHHPFRTGVLVDGAPELIRELRGYAAGAGRDAARTVAGSGADPVFVFSGMGPQWWGMARELLCAEGAFAATAQQVDAAFHEVAGWSIIGELLRPEQESRVTATMIAQPANFLVQVALVDELAAQGIRPGAIVGHSVGEVAAAYVSGVLTLREAVTVAYHRARLQSITAGSGGMLAAGLSVERATALIGPAIDIAAVNSPHGLTLAGDPEELDELAEMLTEQGVFARRLRVEVPYHSRMMDPILPELRTALAHLDPQAPKVPLYSTVTGAPVGAGEWDGEYWCANVRRTVRFAEAVTALIGAGSRVFVEIGPHPVLSGNIRDLLLELGETGATVPTLDREQSDAHSIRATVAGLYRAGALDLDALFPPAEPTPPHQPLPGYPWQRIPLRPAPPASEQRQGSYAMLGDPDPEGRPGRLLRVDTETLPWLADHVVGGVRVLPGAAYMDAALSAAALRRGESRVALENVRFVAPVTMNSPDAPLLELSVEEASGRFLIRSRGATGTVWTVNATGRVLNGSFEATDMVVPVMDSAAEFVPEQFYSALAARGLRYGPAFRRVTSVRADSDTVVATVDAGIAAGSGHLAHPAVVEAAVQVAALLFADDALGAGALVPVAVDAVRLFGALPEQVTVLARRDPTARLRADVELLDASGTRCLQLLGVQVGALDPAASPLHRMAEICYTDEFEPRPPLDPTGLPSADDTATIVIALGSGPRARQLASALPAAVLHHADPTTDPTETTYVTEELTQHLYAAVHALRSAKTPHSPTPDLAHPSAKPSHPPTADSTPGHPAHASTEPAHSPTADSTPGHPAHTSAKPPHSPTSDSSPTGRALASVDSAHQSTIGSKTSTRARPAAESAPGDTGRSGSTRRDRLHVCLVVGTVHDDLAVLWTLKQIAVTLGEFAETLVAPGEVVPALGEGLIDVTLVTEQAFVLPDDAAEPQHRHRALAGARRVLLTEQTGLRWRLIDVDPATELEALVAELGVPGAFTADGTDEILLRAGTRWAPMVTQRIQERIDELGTAHPLADPAADFALELPASRLLSGLSWRASTRRDPEPGQVEVRMRVIGLNYKDPLKVMGLLGERELAGTFFGTSPGMEGVGTVVRLGEGVTALAEGDLVAIAAKDMMRRYHLVDQYAAIRLPADAEPGLCTSSTAFGTAEYALLDLARLLPGETVLIHGAAGGVGSAAVQVARSRGARIIGTASTPERRAHIRTLGVDHALHSRSLNFADDVLRLTDGVGVDVVLNTAPGEILRQNFRAVTEFGRIVEVGKADVYTGGLLDLGNFDKNLSYFSVDLDRMCSVRPMQLADLLRRVYAELEAGVYQPLPFEVFETHEVARAFDEVIRSPRIGRIALSMDDTAPPVRPQLPEVPIHDAATYLISGGFGGFGLATGRWLVSKGARRLVLVDRDGARGADARQQIEAWRAHGVEVVEELADIADLVAVTEVVGRAHRDGYPLRGICHAAGAVADNRIGLMDLDELTRVYRPKAQGARMLHRAVSNAGIELDMFVLYSAADSMFGLGGRYNHSAADLAVEALAEQWARAGERVLCVSWGHLSGATAGTAADEKTAGFAPIDPAEGTGYLEQALRLGLTRAAIIPTDWSRLAAAFPHLRRTGRFSTQIAAEDDSTQARLHAELSALDEGEHDHLPAVALGGVR